MEEDQHGGGRPQVGLWRLQVKGEFKNHFRFVFFFLSNRLNKHINYTCYKY